MQDKINGAQRALSSLTAIAEGLLNPIGELIQAAAQQVNREAEITKRIEVLEAKLEEYSKAKRAKKK